MFGERLKLLRNERGWTINEAAIKISTGRSTYASYETEHRQPPINKLKLLAQIYNVSTDYILGIPEKKINTQNLHDFLNQSHIHWDGIFLSSREIDPIKKLLEIIVEKK